MPQRRLSLRWSRRAGAFCLILATGCAHFSQEDGEALEAQVYGLQTQLEAVRSTVQSLQAEQKAQGEQLARMAEDVGQLNTAARRNDADFGVQLDDVLRDIANLKGSTATLESRLSSLESEATQAQEEMDLKLEDLEQKKAAETAEAEAAKEQERELLSNPPKALRRAESLLADGKPEDARRLVRSLMLARKGSSAFQKRFGAKSQYLIGESYFVGGDFQQAAAEFNRVRKAYPGSSLVPDAYLRLGQCFQRLDLPNDAGLFYKTVIKQFPRSGAAKKARTLLKQLP